MSENERKKTRLKEAGSKYAHQRVELNNKNSAHAKVSYLVGSNKKVLDFGCSSGYLGKVLRDKFNCKVTGIEINKMDVKLAKKHCEKVINCDIESFEWEKELKGQEFDVAIFADVIEHLKDPLEVLRRTKKFLKKNGYIVVSLPNAAHLSVRLELFLGQLRYEKIGLLDDTHLHFYTKTSATKLLKVAGYYITVIDFTLSDIPERVIRQFLKKAGLDYTPELKQIFNMPESIAYQYILKAEVSKPKGYRLPKLSWDKKPSEVISDRIKKLEKAVDKKNKKAQILNKRIQELNARIINLQNDNEFLKTFFVRVSTSKAYRLWQFYNRAKRRLYKPKAKFNQLKKKLKSWAKRQ